MNRVRSDGLPENVSYRDTGCALHSSCLTCPFEKCRYDMPGGVPAMKSDARADAMLELLGAGLTTEQIAEQLGVSRRTVFRLKLRAKDHAATLAAE